MIKAHKFDIIIVGGGMVGAALACALQKNVPRIALIDAAPLQAADDMRLIALNDSSCCLFNHIGIGPILATHGAPIKEIHVSHQHRFGITRINAEEVGLTTLGQVVPAKYINAALYAALQKTNNVTLLRSAALQALTQDTDTVTLAVATAAGVQEYSANIVIGADGSQSTVRTLLNISVENIDYQQSALVTTTQLARDHKNIAYERFQNQGVIAMLPLPKSCAATIWTADNASITRLMQMDDQVFLQQLQQQFGYRLGRLQHVSKRAVYPLHMHYAQQQIKQNVLLIGNAAHTLHPVAAQGFNLALYEVALLADYFLAQPAIKGCLHNFPPDRLQQNFSRWLSHGLTQLFSNDFFLLNISRPAGMIGFDICSLAKKSFAKYILGKAGHVPQFFLKKNTS
jgi:2-octaprenyl-6-methoxyphenol hydroxylase